MRALDENQSKEFTWCSLIGVVENSRRRHPGGLAAFEVESGDSNSDVANHSEPLVLDCSSHRKMNQINTIPNTIGNRKRDCA